MADNFSEDIAEEAIRQFAEITDTDEAFAHFMLQDDNYDLERALTRYYSAQDPDEVYQKFRREGGASDEEGDKGKGSEKMSEHGDGEGSSSNGENANKQPPKKRPRHENAQKEFPAELTMLSWNVDGTQTNNRDKRFLGVLYVIAKVNPEVIFLQEMAVELLPRLNDLMSQMYHIVVADENLPYFCVTLMSKNITLDHKPDIIHFKNTKMDRTMTVVRAQWQRLHLVLINTHLESMRTESEERMAQFSQCMEKMTSLLKNDTNKNETLAIFGGDLNIRDKEVEAVRESSEFPDFVRDVWEAAGSSGNTRFTWDMCRNDNYTDNGKARCRFDRVYFAGPYEDVEFKLEGTSRIRGPNCFPSDHFAIVCRFTSPINTDEKKDVTSGTGTAAGTSMSDISSTVTIEQ